MTPRDPFDDLDDDDFGRIVSFGGDDEPDDEFTRMLRGALRSEASQVHPSDRFAEIMAQARSEETRTADTGRPRRAFRLVGIAAAVLLAAGVGAPFVLPHRTQVDPGSQTTTPSISTSVTPTPTPSGPASLPSMQVGVPVYFLNKTNLLFYRELHDLPTQGDRLTTAASAVLNLAPNDPQYRSEWNGGTVNSVKVQSNVIVIDLSASAYKPLVNEGLAKDAAYQLYYTLNGVLSDNVKPLPLHFLRDGKDDAPYLDQATDPAYWVDGPAVGPVWISAPASSTTVATGVVTVTGKILDGSTAPTVTITRAATGATVASGPATLGTTSGTWQEWTFQYTLDAGSYQVTVDGLNTSETKAFTVK